MANFIQAIEIGTDYSTHNYLPTYNYYNYSMTEQIYTAAEIGMAGTITCIAFYNEGAEKTRTLDFYLKATDKTSFSSKTDWITVSASDKVFSGEVTLVANVWTFVNFTTPFEYDGTSNLVLVVDDNSGEYTSSPHLACSVFNTSSTQAIYIYSDGTNYNPASPTTSQSNNYATLSVKNHIMMGIEASNVNYYDITVSANPTDGGTIEGAGNYAEGAEVTLTATANTGYAFVNWTENGTSVSSDASYTFTVDGDRTLVANFVAVESQTVTLTLGWAWWSTNLNISLEELVEALGDVGISITSQHDGFIGNYSGTWSGGLQTISPSQMYQIQLDQEVTVTVSGVPVDPAECPITLDYGTNWIGYPVSESMSIGEAFAGANPVNGDMVSSYEGSSMYYNGVWYGKVQTLEPGRGYIYESKATGTKTFTYPSVQ